MRYTLVRCPAPQQELRDSDIHAIYYHIGVGASLSLPYSEGILLLPASLSSAEDSVVVASTLGMLWRLRELCGGNGNGGNAAKASEWRSRLGSIKGLLGRREQ